MFAYLYQRSRSDVKRERILNARPRRSYTTQLILINTSSDSINAQLDFYDDNGVKVRSPFP
jgi:hypothetical protein